MNVNVPRLGSEQHSIIKTRDELCRDHPFSGASLEATPETNSIQTSAWFLLKEDIRPTGSSVVINKS